MSELTKQQLRDELVSHGVEVPSASAKKSEYIKKYEQYVAPIARSKGDFSSDDEDLPVNDVKAMKVDTSTMVINGLNISHLEDDDLYSRLKDFGAPVGPIVDSTRSVYQKKLFVLLGGHVPESPAFNGDVNQEEEEEEEYSDNEPEVVPEPPKERPSRQVVTQTESSHTTMFSRVTSGGTSSTSQATEARRRVVPSTDDNLDDSGLLYNPDLHTPSPRRSLRTVTSSKSESTTYRRMVNNGKSSTAARLDSDAVDSPAPPGKASSSLLRILIKLLFLALIIAAALYLYQNNPTESPLKAIEEMARQALEAAAVEDDSRPSEDGSHPPPSPQQAEVTN